MPVSMNPWRTVRCLIHGRLRHHDHCWSCDGVIFDGLLCSGCRRENYHAIACLLAAGTVAEIIQQERDPR